MYGGLHGSFRVPPEWELNFKTREEAVKEAKKAIDQRKENGE
jgi:hypothetical protein